MSDGSSDKNWWERNGEDKTAEAFDKERARIPEDNDYERLKHDVTTGVMKGAYRAGKSLVTGVVDMAIWSTKTLMGHPDVWETNWKVAKKLAKEAWIAEMGTPEEKAEQNRRAVEAISGMAGAVADSMKKDWAQAEKDGKKAELISAWVTQGVVEVASFFIGAGEVKAAARAAKLGELSKTGKAVSALSECPILGKEAAAAKKLLEVEKAQKLLPALARSPVEKLADEVRNLPSKAATIEEARPGSVARMRTNSGKEVSGRSKFADKELDPRLQRALDNVPEALRAPPTQHGRCAEINTINQALKSGESVEGAVIQTAKVKRPGNVQHGIPDPPCKTCTAVLKELGVTYVP